MSYILNALKKSEKQRQANQAESLESQILDQQPQDEPKKTPYWLMILVFVNVCFLAYFIWSFLIEDESSEPQIERYIKETSNQISIDKPIHSSSDIQAKNLQQKSISERIEKQQKSIVAPNINKAKSISTKVKTVNKPIKIQSGKLDTENIVLPKTATIAAIEKPEKSIEQAIIKPDLIKAKTITTQTKPLIKSQKKPINKQETENIVLPKTATIAAIEKPEKNIEQATIKPDLNKAKTITTQTKPLIKSQKKPVKTENIVLPKTATIIAVDKPEVKENIVNNKTNNLPYLTELASDFRRRVPTVDINVFVYSENEAERFIMIDMQKYQSGELIKNGLMLKEIRRNSLIVEYDGRVFQIKRN